MKQSIPNSNFPAAILTLDRHEIAGSPMTIVEGALPEDLQGHVFLLSAAGFENSPPLTDTPWVAPSLYGNPLISGDGMIYRLDFNRQPGQVGLKGKLATTPCYWADKATLEKEEYEQFRFSDLGVARISEWLGVRNVVNTAWLSMQFPEQPPRLMITLDAGRPYEIDLESLELVTPLGWNKEWVKQLEFKLPFELIMSTSHPYFDPQTLEVFTVNYSKSLGSMIVAAFKDDWQEIEDFLPLVERFWEELIALLEKLFEVLEKLIEWQRKYFWLKIFNRFSRLAISMVILWETELLKSFLPDKLKRLGKGLKQHLLEEIFERPSLEEFWEDLWDFRQLIYIFNKLLQDSKYLTDELNLVQDVTYLIRWDGQGALERWKLVLPDGSPVVVEQTIHEMAVTEDYIILMDTSLKIGIEQLICLKNKKLDNFLRSILNFPQASSSTLYFVPRKQLQEGQRLGLGDTNEREVQVQKVMIPKESFHFHANYHSPYQHVTLHVAHASAWDVAEWVRSQDVTTTDNPHPPLGMLVGGMDLNPIGRYIIDGESGAIKESEFISDPDYTWTIGLYAYNFTQHGKDWRPPSEIESIYWNGYGAWQDLLPQAIIQMYREYPYPTLAPQTVQHLTKQGKPSSLFRVDTRQMQIVDGYQFPSTHFGNSPQFIPRANGTGGPTDGYLFCTVNYDDEPSPQLELGKSEIWIFDAQNLKAGPICRLAHPQMKFAFTTHATWLPEIAPRPKDLYYVPVREDYQEKVSQAAPNRPKLQASIEKLFEEEVYPHFIQ